MGTMKPILFNTDMVRSILEGRKTVSRRVVRMKELDEVLSSPARKENPDVPDSRFIKCLCTAPCEAGDILLVRETWSPVNVRPRRYIYKADVDRRIGEGVGLPLCWHPSIHMPREAARIFLRVTGVRVERLRDMVLGDVLMEGIKESDEYEKTWDRWHQTWNSTIKKKDLPIYGWEANPWVWVIMFARVGKEEVGI